ncbi:tRNA (guanine-N(7)-)-methyltransferase-like [Panonychus citri]|uniref:tRNA (guanine-N(7)-)-methyltransferase-like n=1 Tax=Panonychus citri TaxID=50023 RepID=UPI0023074268|nr:tRNA (guanine-N(7)-)-methyltransferase-like [Panonychus citri]
MSANTVVDPPKKRFYRQRAHTNPIADHCFDYPVKPDEMDWTKLYPDYDSNGDKKVELLDVGCGYGGLLVTLASVFPDKLSLGMEIRVKVCDYVQDRIKSLRSEFPDEYNRIACIRSNAMKYLPNYFSKGQLSKIFFLFPDPHFKKTKHKWRIISKSLLADYAFLLRVGGIAYFATDVEQLYTWMDNHFKEHPLFTQLTADEISSDPIFAKLFDCSEEGKKVTRAGGKKFVAAFKRIEDPFLG